MFSERRGGGLVLGYESRREKKNDQALISNNQIYRKCQNIEGIS